MSHSPKREAPIIASFFQVTNSLGSGTFGDVYEAIDLRTNARVAIKVEPVAAKFPQLVYEYRVLQELTSVHGFPRVHWFCREKDINILIMQKLGESVEHMRVRKGGSLPIKVVVTIAIQVLERLQACHIRGIVHRDLKPDNLIFGADAAARRATLFLIDFGLCKRVLEAHTGRHIPFRSGKNLTGTPRYASLRAHSGCEQSRRDDLESLGYVLVFLALGSLPWQGIARPPGCKDKSYRAIADVKRGTDLEQLCAHLPRAFAATINYAKSLEFEDMPNYAYLDGIWREAVESDGPK